MLKKCAPGFVIVSKKHRKWVTYNGKTYYGLPKGGHGQDETYPIHESKVRRMWEILDIEECARKFLRIP